MKLTLTYALIIGVFMIACTSSNKEASSELPSEEVVPMIEGNEISYASDTTEMIGYIALDRNDSSKRPGILIIHEWWGHNDHSRERAEMLAELGYVAFALDMYGDGKNTDHPENAQNFMMAVVSDMEMAKARFESALAQLKNHPNVDSEKIGVVGYCFGGTMALSMASAGYDVDAVAAFHAGLGLPIMPDTVNAIKAQILVANGADDPMISEQQVADFKAVMDATGANYKYVSYDGAVHGFTNKGADAIAGQHEMLNGALAYNAEADSASWEEMKVLFESAFK